MTLSALGIFSAAGAGGVAASSYELIETVILGSAQATITFSSLGTYSSTYKHLQIRAVSRTDRASNYADNIRLRLNGSSSTLYARHQLQGDNSAVTSGGIGDVDSMFTIGWAGGALETNSFGASVIDLLDPYSTTKFKTARSLAGVMGITTGGNNNIQLSSGMWRSTDSVTSISLTATNSFQSGSRFSLYGVK